MSKNSLLIVSALTLGMSFVSNANAMNWPEETDSSGQTKIHKYFGNFAGKVRRDEQKKAAEERANDLRRRQAYQRRLKQYNYNIQK